MNEFISVGVGPGCHSRGEHRVPGLSWEDILLDTSQRKVQQFLGHKNFLGEMSVFHTRFYTKASRMRIDLLPCSGPIREVVLKWSGSLYHLFMSGQHLAVCPSCHLVELP